MIQPKPNMRGLSRLQAGPERAARNAVYAEYGVSYFPAVLLLSFDFNTTKYSVDGFEVEVSDHPQFPEGRRFVPLTSDLQEGDTYVYALYGVIVPGPEEAVNLSFDSGPQIYARVRALLLSGDVTEWSEVAGMSTRANRQQTQVIPETGPELQTGRAWTVAAFGSGFAGLNQITMDTDIPNPDYTIDWGDGTVESFTDVVANRQHIYSAAGIYLVQMYGPVIPGGTIGGGIAAPQEFLQWGTDPVHSVKSMFIWSGNMSISPDVDLPTFVNNPINAEDVFNGASSSILSGIRLGEWVGFKPSTLEGAFSIAQAVDPLDLSSWDMSACTSIKDLFRRAYMTSIDVTGWQLPLVTDAEQAFAEITGLESPLDVTGLFPPGNVLAEMTFMFNRFGVQVIGLDSWEVKQVAAASAFMQDAPNTLDTAAYDAVLAAWSAQSPLVRGLQIVFSSTYTDQASKDILLAEPNRWTIFDSGPA